jgi:type VI protein secretion system component Hcp
MQHKTSRAALAALAFTLAIAATPVQAASADYYLKLDGIPGESTEKGAKGHKEWIDVASLRFAPEAQQRGGVNVAVGDVTGDGTADATSGRPTGRRTYEPITIRKRIDKSSPVAPKSGAAAAVAAAPGNPQPVGLLLPAVQKVREAAARMPAWAGCKVGQPVPGLTLKDAKTGREARILDATVSACASEQVSFNFTKIEWK